MDAAQLRHNSICKDEDGNILWHGVKLGEFWKTDMQVAIDKRNRREDASFSIRVRKAAITLPFQQTIPMDFARCYKNLLQEIITLEGPTGRTWTTILRDFHQGPRFGKGWRQFSVENHLREGHQLLFTLVGKFRFLVHFFDHLGKRCTSYPPLPVVRSGPSLSVAETRPQCGLQPVMDGGQASHRHGSEAQTSAAAPLMETTSAAIPPNFDWDNVILRQHGPELPRKTSLPYDHMRHLEKHTSNAGNDSEDMRIEDEGNQELRHSIQNYIFQGSDIDKVPIDHRPATMQTTPLNPERNIHTLNELSRGKQPVFHSPDNRAHSPQMQDRNSSPSRSDELPFQYYPEMRKKPVTLRRLPPVATPIATSYEAGCSSGSSPAMLVLQQQGCTRFGEIKLTCKRRPVSDQERRVVVETAKRFVSGSETEMLTVVMRDEQVYHRFHLAIPRKILEATGTERASKVEVCLLDREQSLYRTHWTRPDVCDTPMLDRDAWAKFAVDHALEEGDVCVFQLLQLKPSVSMPALLFCVHIFRVVEILVGQLDCSRAS